jgi:hypothetical protein
MDWPIHDAAKYMPRAKALYRHRRDHVICFLGRISMKGTAWKNTPAGSRGRLMVLWTLYSLFTSKWIDRDAFRGSLERVETLAFMRANGKYPSWLQRKILCSCRLVVPGVWLAARFSEVLFRVNIDRSSAFRQRR